MLFTLKIIFQFDTFFAFAANSAEAIFTWQKFNLRYLEKPQ